MPRSQRRNWTESQQKHGNIKFKILRDDLLPHLKPNHHSRSLGFSKFSKQSFENGWKGQAELKKQMSNIRAKQRQGQYDEMKEMKLRLKNEANALLLKKQNMQRRFQANLLVRIAMKQLASNQEMLLKTNSYLQKL